MSFTYVLEYPLICIAGSNLDLYLYTRLALVLAVAASSVSFSQLQWSFLKIEQRVALIEGNHPKMGVVLFDSVLPDPRDDTGFVMRRMHGSLPVACQISLAQLCLQVITACFFIVQPAEIIPLA